MQSTVGLISTGLRMIIVPHEPTEYALRRIESLIPCTRWSNTTPETGGHLLVDKMGLLLSLYTIGDAAFVGGGFGGGVHSVTEAAGCGLPTACGPRIERSRDAEALQDSGVLNVVRDSGEMRQWLNRIVLDTEARSRMSTDVRQFMSERTGSSAILGERFLRMLLQQVQLPSR